MSFTPIAKSLNDLAASEEQMRLRRFHTAWERYYGRYPASLKVRPGQPDDNVVVNKCKVIVDKSVAFLFGQAITFELDETAETPAEEWLEAVWRDNHMATTLVKLAMNGAVTGHVFVKVRPATVPGGSPRLIVLDPATVSVEWDRDDFERVTRYTITYTARNEAGKLRNYRQVIAPDGATWTITDQESDPDNPQWITTGTEPWPYAWPPVLDCQNLPMPNEYWGVADIEEDLIKLNSSRNFLLTNGAKIIRHHAHPRTWGRGFGAKGLNTGPDEVIVLPGENGELHNLEMQSDLASTLHMDARLDEAIHEIGRTPAISTGKLESIGNLSGVALAILYQPLVEKTEQKRLLYGDLLVELCRCLLEMGGFGPDNFVSIGWFELLPGDPLAERQVALLDKQLGVSDDTILGKLGYDADTEAKKKSQETQNTGAQLLTAFDRGTAEGASQ